MRERILHWLASEHAHHPWRMMAVVLVFTFLFAVLAGNLTMTSRWSDLLPEGDMRTVEFNKILSEFVSATSLIVVLQGDEWQMKKCADELAVNIVAAVDTRRNAEINVKIDELQRRKDAFLNGQETEEIARLDDEIGELRSSLNRKLVRRVDYRTDEDFIRRHGLMLIKKEDLVNLAEVFTDPNLIPFINHLNTSLEKEYVNRSESISTRQEQDTAVMFLDGIQDFIHLLRRYQSGEALPEQEARRVVEKLLHGEPYYLSYDETALVLNVVPNFTLMDTDLLVAGTDEIQKIVDETLEDYPGLKAGLTGMIAVGRDEMVYSQQSLGITSGIAFIAILILLILSLRMWSAPLLAGINLIVGIIWASGVAAVAVGQLNIMTSMFAVILLGLGIDFSIHLLSGFTEYRASGLSIADAMHHTLGKIGRGIFTGGLTTAIAFTSMIISRSRGMKEMGLVTGLGLLAIMISTFLFMPALLVLREKIRRARPPRALSFRFLGRFAGWMGDRPFFTLATTGVITLLLFLSAMNIGFDQNYMNIEPKGLISIALQDTIMNKYDLSMDYGLVLAESVEESRRLAGRYRDLGTVASVEDISFYLPSQLEQRDRRPLVLRIHESISASRVARRLDASQMTGLIQELERLQMNIMEMQDLAYLGGQERVYSKCAEMVGDPAQEIPVHLLDDLVRAISENSQQAAARFSRFQRHASPYFRHAVLQMSDTTEMEMGSLPERLLDRYANAGRDRFLVTIFPAGHVWQDADFLRRFSDDLGRISERATGMPPVFRALIEIIGRDGRNAALLTLGIMFLLLWIDFRRPGYAIMAMVPLGVGVLWMVGLMHLCGEKLTVMNVMGIPLIIGIGIDDGVHVIHRWMGEKEGKMQFVFTSTGKAILLTSLTTMLGFGSLTFSIWRGFGQLGSALFIGVAACFLTTVMILPGLLGLMKRKKAR